jgi:hypothetical protein
MWFFGLDEMLIEKLSQGKMIVVPFAKSLPADLLP